jgi:hypothetical protein
MYKYWIKKFFTLYKPFNLYPNFTKIAIRIGLPKHSYRVISNIYHERPVRNRSVVFIYEEISKLCNKNIKDIEYTMMDLISTVEIGKCSFCQHYYLDCKEQLPKCLLITDKNTNKMTPILNSSTIIFIKSTGRPFQEKHWR